MSLGIPCSVMIPMINDKTNATTTDATENNKPYRNWQKNILAP